VGAAGNTAGAALIDDEATMLERGVGDQGGDAPRESVWK